MAGAAPRCATAAAAGLARAGRLKWPYIVVGDDACIQKCSCTLGKEERNIYSAPFIDTTRAHACPCPFREHVGREIEGVGCKPITRDPIALHRLTKSAILCESSFKATYRHANESCEQSVISSSWAANGATEVNHFDNKCGLCFHTSVLAYNLM